MKACIRKVKDVGSCTYCRKGKSEVNGTRLEFPYEEVVEIIGNGSSSRLCFECVGEITKLQELG